MRLNAQLKRWRIDWGYAKADGLTPINSKLSVLGINREVGAVCFPGEMHHETAEKIRQQSPFDVTLIIGYITHPGCSGVGYVTTASKLELGGYHSSSYSPEAEWEVIRTATELLSDVRESFV